MWLLWYFLRAMRRHLCYNKYIIVIIVMEGSTVHANHSKSHQMSLFNELGNLPERTINWLIHSWAFVFRLFIYPLIDPASFDCLYSVVESRPANPPQVIVSLLIIKEMFGKTDDQMHDWMMSNALDLRFATNTVGMDAHKLPTSDKQLTRFRERNRDYAQTHGGNCPLDECLRSLSFGMAAMMGLSLKNVRIDSTMVSANIARMNKEEILYTINRTMVFQLCSSRDDNFKAELDQLQLGHYLEPGDRNAVIYHSHADTAYKGMKLAGESQTILDLCGRDDLETENGKLFQRILHEKTILEENGKRRMATAGDGIMKPSDVQNPADPDATYREKARKSFIGYIVNLVESVGPLGSLVLSWDFEQNIASDAVMAYAFLKEAGAIMDGIRSWQEQFAIPADADMEKCQELLKAKMDMVVETIQNARSRGISIPRSINTAIGFSEEGTDTDDDSRQMTLDDLLASFCFDHDISSGPEEAGENDVQPIVDEDRHDADKDFVPELITITNHIEGSAPEPGWTVLGKPGPEGILLPEFADLDDDVRREAILKLVREKHPWQIDGSVNYSVADGAYSTEELMAAYQEEGYQLCPTDLLGKKTNPVIALFVLDSDRQSVVRCPKGNIPLSQSVYKNGQIRLNMKAEHCRNCSFRNDCKCRFLSRKDEASIMISPNAQSRIFTEANLGSEEYKNVGRFRNGIETIPSFLHNCLDIDHMPMGFKAKEACMALKVTALNFRKFTLFLRGQSRIAANPILSRA